MRKSKLKLIHRCFDSYKAIACFANTKDMQITLMSEELTNLMNVIGTEYKDNYLSAFMCPLCKNSYPLKKPIFILNIFVEKILLEK